MYTYEDVSFLSAFSMCKCAAVNNFTHNDDKYPPVHN